MSTATQLAATVGQGMALVFAFLGLLFNPFLIFIAFFVWIAAAEEGSMVQMRSALDGIPVERAMITHFRTLRPDDTLAQAVEHGDSGADEASVARAFAQFATAPGNDPAALAACLRGRRRRIDAGQLTGLTRPVLVVLGDRDFAGPANPLLDALPDGRLVTLRGADHFGTPKDFRFLDAALEFLEASPV